MYCLFYTCWLDPFGWLHSWILPYSCIRADFFLIYLFIYLFCSLLKEYWSLQLLLQICLFLLQHFFFFFFLIWLFHILPKFVSQRIILLLSTFSCISTTYNKFELSPRLLTRSNQSFLDNVFVKLGSTDIFSECPENYVQILKCSFSFQF